MVRTSSAGSCSLPNLCGKFVNSTVSKRDLYVVDGWGANGPTGTMVRLPPGHGSMAYMPDADGIYASCAFSIGWNRYAGGQWYKIGDSYNIRTVNVHC